MNNSLISHNDWEEIQQTSRVHLLSTIFAPSKSLNRRFTCLYNDLWKSVLVHKDKDIDQSQIFTAQPVFFKLFHQP